MCQAFSGSVGPFFCLFVTTFGGTLSLGECGFKGLHVGQHQFDFNHLDIGEWIDLAGDMDDIGILKAADHLEDGIDFADVAEELVAKAFALAGAFDNACNVDQGEGAGNDFLRGYELGDAGQAGIRHRDNTLVRLDGAERVICRLSLFGTGEGVEQGAFAHIG